MRILHSFLILCLLLIGGSGYSRLEGAPAQLTEAQSVRRLKEMMSQHALYKRLTPELMERVIVNYLELLDPYKSYLTESEVERWLKLSVDQRAELVAGVYRREFSFCDALCRQMQLAIERRHRIEAVLGESGEFQPVVVWQPRHELRELEWASDEAALASRLREDYEKGWALLKGMSSTLREEAMGRLEKRRRAFESYFQNEGSEEYRNNKLTLFLQAAAQSLDSQTAYFTPDEALRFLVEVQRSLVGVGIVLRDALDGFAVMQLLEGGPAERAGILVGDKIIGVSGEVVVGMEISEVIDLLQGSRNSVVAVSVVRGEAREPHDFLVRREEVFFPESRFSSEVTSSSVGDLATLKLYSFYQDEHGSSAEDLRRTLRQLRMHNNIVGVILDLRGNPGGVLEQAIAVTALFMERGVIGSIQDSAGNILRLRNLEGELLWNGPLVVLIDMMSASAAEIVAQALQDYGIALVVGDAHSFGKGSYQMVSVRQPTIEAISPQGEYKVTKGRYYTVSGKTPQQVGVASDIVVPGPYSFTKIGERFSSNPLPSGKIAPAFDDDLSDLPVLERWKIGFLYQFHRQGRYTFPSALIDQLRRESAERLAANRTYQSVLKLYKKYGAQDMDEQFILEDLAETTSQEEGGRVEEELRTDFQLPEAEAILERWISLTSKKQGQNYQRGSRTGA